MARRIREEYIDDDTVLVDRPDTVYVERPVTRRVVTERRYGYAGGAGYGMNPLAWVLAGILVVFILVLLFGGLR